MSHSKVIRAHAHRTTEAKDPAGSEWNLTELSARFGVSPGPFKLAVSVAQRLPVQSVHAVSRWVDVLAELDATKQQECAAVIGKALEGFNREDPLADVDEPMTLSVRLQAAIQAEKDVEASRRLILIDSVSAEDAVRKSGRSRQNLEAMRRKNHVLALRVGNQWRYPAWQFDPDGVGGVVGGLREVVASLRMSAAGAALWLIHPSQLLDDARPIDRLRQGWAREVVKVAEQLGYAP